MRFLPKSRSHDSEASVVSDPSSSVSAASSGTARARIARYGARHAHSQSSPTHRDHASGPPTTHEWAGPSDDDDTNEENEADFGGRGQSSRLMVCFDDADLKDTHV